MKLCMTRALLALCFLVAACAAAASPEPSNGSPRVSLPGHVLTGVASLSRTSDGRADAKVPHSADTLDLTIILRRSDEAGFQAFLADVYDPTSIRYLHFLGGTQQAERFGPSREEYVAVRDYL